MLAKIINPNLATSNSINTDHETSGVGLDTAIVKKAEKAGEGRYWVLDAIQYSYSPETGVVSLAVPVKGGILIMDGGKVIWDADIPDFTGVLNLYIPASPGNDLEIRLKSAGLNYVGKLNTQCHIEASQ
jgi:hypothetical protein